MQYPWKMNKKGADGGESRAFFWKLPGIFAVCPTFSGKGLASSLNIVYNARTL
ncbi:hypothetical protein [Evtepia sp.]